MEGLFFLMVIVKIFCSFALGVLMLYKPINRNLRYWYDDIFTITPSVTSVSITVAVIATFLAVEALQYILYLGSDWAIVSLGCSFITGRSHGFVQFALRKRLCFPYSDIGRTD
uniref:Uncharacterized protein n=1 Tax=Arundo donax TaxID=35708 RepID=A0A0A8YZB8_ARUDO